MALSRTPVSITDIEQQIATVTAELEKARAQHFAAAEADYLAAQKTVASAQTKVNELSAKATTTAAQNRLALARAALEEQETKLTATKNIFDQLTLEQEAAQDFNEKVELLLAGKKIGKKIKFTKKEKAVLKADKKAAKKIAKAEKKLAKDEKAEAKKNAKAESKLLKAQTAESEKSGEDEQALAPVAAVTAKPAASKAAPKKAPAKKPVVKKTAPAAKPAEVVDAPLVEPVVSAVNEELVKEEPAKAESIEAEVTAVPETTSIETIITADVNPEARDAGIENLDPNADA